MWNVSWCSSPQDGGCCWSYETEQEARAEFAKLRERGVWHAKLWTEDASKPVDEFTLSHPYYGY